MARDYSARKNGHRKNGGKAGSKTAGKRNSVSAKKRRSAPKKNTRKKNTGTPKWVWFGCLLFFAIAVGAVSWIATRPTGHPGRDFSKVDVPQPETTADSNQSSKKADKKPQPSKFAFYEMLPDYEVVIPGEMDKIKRRSNAASSSATTTTATQPGQKSSTAANDAGKHYIIQVGAFSKSKDANQLRAKVTLLGLQAKVVKSASESGKPIYRVRSDVITSDSRLTELLQRLHDKNIETLVLRRSK